MRSYYTLVQQSWKGAYWFHLVRLSIRPSVCPSADRIMSTLYLPQHWTDPFHIYAFFSQLQKECCVFSVVKNSKIWNFGNFFKFIPLILSCLTWDPIWINNIGNHGVVGVSSDAGVLVQNRNIDIDFYVFKTASGMVLFFVDENNTYCKTSSISRTKSQNLNVSCILLQLSSLNPLKPGVKLRMKM